MGQIEKTLIEVAKETVRQSAGVPEYRGSYLRSLLLAIRGLLARHRHWVASRASLEEFGLLYANLEARNRELEMELGKALRHVDALQTDVAIRDAQLAVRQVEITELTLVTQRNRLRIEAEMAATQPPQRPRED